MTMTRIRRPGRPGRTILILAPLAVLLAGAAHGDETGPSIGLELGYHHTPGAWNDHRYAPGVEQFRGGLCVRGDLETRLFGQPIAFTFGYTRFGTDDWVDYARSQGDEIASSASLYTYGALYRHYFPHRGTSLVALELGVEYQRFEGRESYAGFTYDYDFLADELGFLLGLSAQTALSPRLFLCLNVRGTILFDGVRYADGDSHNVFALPLTLGLRHLL